VTKDLEPIAFDPKQCRKELAAFKKLLDNKEALAERADIQAFFKARKQLSAFLGATIPRLGIADCLAHEFPIQGDYAADVMLGNRGMKAFCAVEFENGNPGSIFTKVPSKSTREWSRRFEHGFSQLVDWFHALDDLKKTDRFAKDFGQGHIRFIGLIILGRSTDLTDYDKSRLAWRSEKVLVDSHPIECMTYDGLYEHLSFRISFFPRVSRSG